MGRGSYYSSIFLLQPKICRRQSRGYSNLYLWKKGTAYVLLSSPAKGHINWSSLVAHLPYSVRVEGTKVTADLEMLELTPETYLQVLRSRLTFKSYITVDIQTVQCVDCRGHPPSLHPTEGAHILS